MRALLLIVASFVMLLGAATFALGNKQTERFIPIGQSPGLSGKYTTVGKIEKTDAARRTVAVGGVGESRTVKVTERTRIWLDRSQLKLMALTGGFTDLQIGRRIEVKYEDRNQVAEWIKVEVSAAATTPDATRKP